MRILLITLLVVATSGCHQDASGAAEQGPPRRWHKVMDIGKRASVYCDHDGYRVYVRKNALAVVPSLACKR